MIGAFVLYLVLLVAVSPLGWIIADAISDDVID